MVRPVFISFLYQGLDSRK